MNFYFYWLKIMKGEPFIPDLWRSVVWFKAENWWRIVVVFVEVMVVSTFFLDGEKNMNMHIYIYIDSGEGTHKSQFGIRFKTVYIYTVDCIALSYPHPDISLYHDVYTQGYIGDIPQAIYTVGIAALYIFLLPGFVALYDYMDKCSYIPGCHRPSTGNLVLNKFLSHSCGDIPPVFSSIQPKQWNKNPSFLGYVG